MVRILEQNTNTAKRCATIVGNINTVDYNLAGVGCEKSDNMQRSPSRQDTPRICTETS